FDPDGRLIATDNSNQDQASTLHKSFRFTAKTPGVYYFAVTRLTDINYNGEVDASGSTQEPNASVGLVPYQLDLLGGGNLALGGIVGENIANTDFLDFNFAANAQPSFQVKNGDFGALYTAGAGVGTSSGGDGAIFGEASTPLTVDKGNL